MASVFREQKEKQVAQIAEQLTAAKSFVLIDYMGLTVEQDTALRNEFRKNGVKYHVMKNTLVRRALNNMGYKEFDKALNGPTSVAMGMKDEISPAKIAFDKSNEFKKMNIKCGMADKKFINEEECKALAAMPPKEVLIAQLLGLLQSPIASLARALDAIAQKNA